MAKSLRSKRMRKMRAIKRERYAVKELKQLKSILANTDKKEDETGVNTVLPIKSEEAQNRIGESSGTMEVDVKPSPYHPVKLTNEHGNYPPWMNQRKIKKHKLMMKRKAGKKNKRN
ncbi:hypothetical protein JTE90_012137 [Oedothorax gibbosus]|uniref:Protein LLP homolog n=1 Tax=Oedothorax gibbosus TaxID=931172 RepID=A0AAV6U7W5_9ARAC|nr:hypothetical protein JTE90_012137 [Oedothorax gibbosus]